MRKPAVFALILIVSALLYFSWQRRPQTQTSVLEVPSSSIPTTPAATPMASPTTQPNALQKAFDDVRPVLQQKAAVAQNKDLHTTPPQTIDAAHQLAGIIELQEQHPEDVVRFQAFYLECARDESVITVIRAQCLDLYVKGAKLDPAAQKTFISDFPPEIIRLFEALQ